MNLVMFLLKMTMCAFPKLHYDSDYCASIIACANRSLLIDLITLIKQSLNLCVLIQSNIMRTNIEIISRMLTCSYESTNQSHNNKLDKIYFGFDRINITIEAHHNAIPQRKRHLETFFFRHRNTI